MYTIAGPCSIDFDTPTFVKFVGDMLALGVYTIRGGVWKYRSDPSTYQGSDTALEAIKAAKHTYDFIMVTEIFNAQQLAEHVISSCIDIIQVGSRNMYNTDLLKAINVTKKPVILKRHFAASLTEFLRHKEYLADCPVSLCLRGIMGLHPEDGRFLPDHYMTERLRHHPLYKGEPIIYDVSHSATDKAYILPDLLASLCYNPSGVMIEVHPDVASAQSDAKQQLSVTEFTEIYNKYLRRGI